MTTSILFLKLQKQAKVFSSRSNSTLRLLIELFATIFQHRGIVKTKIKYAAQERRHLEGQTPSADEDGVTLTEEGDFSPACWRSGSAREPKQQRQFSSTTESLIDGTVSNESSPKN